MNLRDMKRGIYDGIWAYLVEGGFESVLQWEIENSGTIAEKARLERAIGEVIDEIARRGS